MKFEKRDFSHLMPEDEFTMNLKQYCIENPIYWTPPSSSVPPWNKGRKGDKDSKVTKGRKSLARKGKKFGSYKTSNKWDPKTKKARCEAMKKAWTPERRAALAERNRMRALK